MKNFSNFMFVQCTYIYILKLFSLKKKIWYMLYGVPLDFCECCRRFLLSAIMTENQSSRRLPIAVNCCGLHSTGFVGNPLGKNIKMLLVCILFDSDFFFFFWKFHLWKFGLLGLLFDFVYFVPVLSSTSLYPRTLCLSTWCSWNVRFD